MPGHEKNETTYLFANIGEPEYGRACIDGDEIHA